VTKCDHKWRSHGFDPDWCEICGVEKIAFLQQENTQLKEELQALRERLKGIEIVTSHASYEEFCPGCNKDYDSRKTIHESDCWLKAELDKLEAK
jgi:beta-galactosidase GanA